VGSDDRLVSTGWGHRATGHPRGKRRAFMADTVAQD
jgi:hypothetical protein